MIAFGWWIVYIGGVLIVLSCRLENLSFRCLFWLGFALVVTFVVLIDCLLIVEVVVVVAGGVFGHWLRLWGCWFVGICGLFGVGACDAGLLI